MDNPNNIKKPLKQSIYLVASVNNINFNNNEISIGNMNIITSKEGKNEIKKFLTNRINTTKDLHKNNFVNKIGSIKFKKIQPANIINKNNNNNCYNRNNKIIIKDNNINNQKNQTRKNKKLNIKLDENKINKTNNDTKFL